MVRISIYDIKTKYYVIDTDTTAENIPPNDPCQSGQSASAQYECACPCCSQGSEPNQPMDVTDHSKQPYSHHSEELKKTKTYSRSLQTSWYKKYPWISVCGTRYKIFCHSCRSAKHEGLLVFSKRQLNCFVEDGFSNWKNALARLEEHERSEMHREAVVKLAAKASTVDIGVQLNAQNLSDQKLHRCMLAKLLSSIRFWLVKDYHYVGVMKILIHWKEICISSFYLGQRIVRN